MGNTHDVVITGGTGFLGRAVAERLPNALAIGSRDVDLTDRADVLARFSSWKPKIIIHLAGRVGGITANMAAPADFLIDNTHMAMNVLEAAKRIRPEHLLVTLSTCMYPNQLADDDYPMDESLFDAGPPPPTNAPYALAKRALLVGTRALHEQYGIPFTALIPTNLYGPGDHFGEEGSHFLAAAIDKVERARRANAEHVTFFGTGIARRQFAFADDVARLIESCVSSGPSNETYNVASSDDYSIADIATCVARVAGFKGDVVFSGKGPDGQFRKDVSTRRLRNAFPAWAASETSLEDGIQKTLAWYRAQPEHARPAHSG